MKKIAAVILSYNEEIHIGRCLESILNFVDKIYLVDSFSTDRTTQIAESFGAEIFFHEYVNHATQLNYALSLVSREFEWIIRIDCDEYFLQPTCSDLAFYLNSLPDTVAGVQVIRQLKFMGDFVNRGGLYPVYVTRIFRNGRSHCENRWMDEHIIVDGLVYKSEYHIIDDNLNDLTWWINKHNLYSNREAVDFLVTNSTPQDDRLCNLFSLDPVSRKRWVKIRIYNKLPLCLRPMLYFFYRMVIKLGLFDTRGGVNYHLLQGFFYRYLVDLKVGEVKRHQRMNGLSLKESIFSVLRITI